MQILVQRTVSLYYKLAMIMNEAIMPVPGQCVVLAKVVRAIQAMSKDVQVLGE